MRTRAGARRSALGRAGTAALALALVATLGACSDDGDDGDADRSTTTTFPTTTSTTAVENAVTSVAPCDLITADDLEAAFTTPEARQVPIDQVFPVDAETGAQAAGTYCAFLLGGAQPLTAGADAAAVTAWLGTFTAEGSGMAHIGIATGQGRDGAIGQLDGAVEEGRVTRVELDEPEGARVYVGTEKAASGEGSARYVIDQRGVLVAVTVTGNVFEGAYTDGETCLGTYEDGCSPAGNPVHGGPGEAEMIDLLTRIAAHIDAVEN